ncbi:MAG: hypothetical protein IPJ60_18675 [Sphingobacteriaceae bacterium]|nr:hypothetical protein [Sphingobacteriaceae bacterium]
MPILLTMMAIPSSLPGRAETDSADRISTDDDDFIRFRWDWQDEDEYF